MYIYLQNTLNQSKIDSVIKSRNRQLKHRLIINCGSYCGHYLTLLSIVLQVTDATFLIALVLHTLYVYIVRCTCSGRLEVRLSEDPKEYNQK